MSLQETKRKEYRFILIALLLITGFFVFKEMRPYLGGFLGAFTLYIILRPQMKFLVERKSWGRGLSAGLILVEALLCFLLPLAGTGLLVADKLSGIQIDLDAIRIAVTDFLAGIENKYGVDVVNLDFLSFLPSLGGDAVQLLASGSYSFLINFFVVIFVLYFMLYSYKNFEQMLREILPFSEQNKQTFISETKAIIKANAIGIPLLAIIQGLFAYLGYLLFSVPGAGLYAVLTAFASVLPVVGTAIVYAPLAIVFLLDAKYGSAIGLLLYGIIIIGGVDNVVRFLLQKKIADIHPLITVFGVLVGLPMFGFWGVIFGPLVLSLFVLFFNMYRHDYIPGSTAQPHITSDIQKIDYSRIKNINFPLPKKKKSNPPSGQSQNISL